MLSSPKTSLRKMFDWSLFQKKRIYYFKDGSIEDYGEINTWLCIVHLMRHNTELLGSKGANLCEMSRLGIPMASGFIITAETCAEYCEQKHNNAAITQLMAEYLKGVKEIEKQTGKSFGKVDTGDTLPLLLSVRSGAALVMPGLTDTVLNLGINDELVQAMARISNNPRWAYDTYRRFLQMYGTVVLHVERTLYDSVMREALDRRGVADSSQLTAEDLIEVVQQFKSLTGGLPQDPWEQLRTVIAAMFCSWYSPLAVRFRAVNNVKSEFGCALVVQSMVFGDLNQQSGSGIAFTRNPVTGDSFVSGEYLICGTGQDLLCGERKSIPLAELRTEMPEVYGSLIRHNTKLEKHYRDMQEVEFTVENGALFILETRRGKRTAVASVQMAVAMVMESVIYEREALLRINPRQMDYFCLPVVDPQYVNSEESKQEIVAQGLPASPGAATGRLVFSSKEAVASQRRGEACVLCKTYFEAEDILGLKAATGAVLLHSGPNSYAAEVLRSRGHPVITGLRSVGVDQQGGSLVSLEDGRTVVSQGDLVTVDGATGVLYRGSVPTCEAGSGEFFSIVVGWADKYKRMHVHASADSVEDVQRAHDLGAEGIGEFRTETMFRREGCADLLRQTVLSDSEEQRCTFLAKLIKSHEQQFLQVFRIMDHRPVTVRLLSIGLHELFPDPDCESFAQDLQEVADRLGVSPEHCSGKVREFYESSASLGRKSNRLAVMFPEVVIAQTKAIVNAALLAKEEGIEVFPNVLLPLVSGNHEAAHVSALVHSTWAKTCEDAGHSVNYLIWGIGCLLQDPRACLQADKVLSVDRVDFVAISSDDLTELSFGISRPDSTTLLQSYLDKHLQAKSPFESLDVQAVGSLVHLATNKSKQERPKALVTVCGEHCGDPFSVRFFNRVGVDVVCCAPNKIAVAKVAAAQAEVEQSSVYRGKYHMWPYRGDSSHHGDMSLNDNIYRRLLAGEILL